MSIQDTASGVALWRQVADEVCEIVAARIVASQS